jgi:murein DD-endopeptidase MepM/ murein hydrolase activator NlpD
VFQHDIMGHHKPDGRVDPGGKTLKRLNGSVPSPLDPVPKSTKGKGVDPPSPPNTAGTESFNFPFPQAPGLHWTGGSRFFGAPRGKMRPRRHAGCDLIFPRGTKIYAIADGTKVRGPYVFTSPASDPPYPQSDASEVVQGPILVRYGEIEPGSYVGGKEVKKGQVLAKVSSLGMLHFEVYTNPGNLAEGLSNEVYPFKRRSDLTNPDPYLQLWVKNLPTP